MAKLRLSSSSRAIVSIIIIVSLILSVLVYSYFSYSTASIQNSATQATNVNARIEATDLASSLSNRLNQIASNLVVLSGSQAIQDGNASSAGSLVRALQNTTAGFTSSYDFFSADGEVIAASNPEEFILPLGNLSERPFFVEAVKVWPSTYIDPEYTSPLNSTNYILFARGVYKVTTTAGGTTTSRKLVGVLAAAVDFLELGDTIREQLATPVQAELSVVDYNGTILFAGDNASNAGKDAFSSQVQQQVPASVKGAFDAFLNSSLSGRPSTEDFAFKAGSVAVASQPMLFGSVLGNGADNRVLAVMFVASPSTLAAAQVAQVDGLQAFVGTVIIGIAGSAVFGSIFVLKRNKTLTELVKERTAELEESKVQLEDANKKLVSYADAQTDFVNIAAHEIRTPLQPILTITELVADSLRDGTGKDTAQISKGEMDILERGVKRLDDMTRNLLEVSRMEAGTGLNLRHERFDLNEAVASEISAISRRASGPLYRRPEIGFTSSGGPLVVIGDRGRISEVVANLVSNALKASDGPRPAKVEVSCSDLGEEAIVKVRDYGRGLRPEMRQRLFTKFGSDSESGLGLGLYLSKKIVEGHGGRIWAEDGSDGEGGASFCFSLPTDRKVGA
jgi:signal transduction histidine kinase